jgi:cytochrome c556
MRSSDQRLRIAVLAAVIIGSSSLALAQVPKGAAEIVPFRQQQMKSLGGAFKAVTDQLKAPAPNLDTIRTNAATMQRLAADIPTWFPAGTGPETGIKMTAKPEIWTNRSEFEAKAKALQAAVGGLVGASTGSDVAAIGAAARPVGMACQGCHTEFRLQPPRPGAPPPAAAPPPPPLRGPGERG